MASPMFLVRLGVLDYSHRFIELTSFLAVSRRLDLTLLMVITLQHHARFALCNLSLLGKKEEEYFIFFCPSKFCGK